MAESTSNTKSEQSCCCFKNKNYENEGHANGWGIWNTIVFVCSVFILNILTVAFFVAFIILVASNNISIITWVMMGLFIFFFIPSTICCFCICRGLFCSQCCDNYNLFGQHNKQQSITNISK